METPKAVLELVERFEAHRDVYCSPEYNETQVRREFIDPFFEALGWDVQNRSGFAEQYKQVVHEDSIKIGGVTKAPDYSFRLGGRRLFFLEAKKPFVNLKEDPSPAYQLRRYAWTAKLPVSILTDFEEFIVYDTRVKPALNDAPSTARVLNIPYTDYPRRWNEIGSLFSPQAIQKGALDKYVESTTKKRGTAEVDDAFLAEIEEWRDQLARTIALRNPDLSQRALNDAVQRTIDRIVFLRICEDRGIEDYGRLMALQNGDHVYERLCDLFRQADDRYNSGLFHFRREPGRDEYDNWTLGLALDDSILKDILRDLYYPDSPYEFSVLPADILGQVYEQFLGKVIRLTKGHRAVVEDKPEVKKAGGVYYTPTYIVDYIVKNTVGKLLEGKRPRDIDGSKKGAQPLRVLDPACGSGSFLISAYQYLLDWYRECYVADGPEAHAKGRNPRLFQDRTGEWRLTGPERKRILLAHIFGVDIDPQAVEVTKLSLLLKVLEGETSELLQRRFAFDHERALPDLASNIKCGNSLIGPDFYQGKQTDFDDEETYRINALDWNAEFPHIMQSGGFDAVIGNPPYIRIQTMKEWAPVEVEFYKVRYRSAASGNYDIYVVFIEKGLSLLNADGRLGFICPHKFFNAKYGEGIRRVISEGNCLHHVVHFGSEQIFGKATTYTCLLFLCAGDSPLCDFISVSDVCEWRKSGFAIRGSIPAKEIASAEWSFVVGQSGGLFRRLQQQHQTLGHLCDIFVGLQTSADSVFILNFVGRDRDSISLRSEVLGQELPLEPNLFHPLVSGTDVNRYRPLPERQYILCPYRMTGGRPELIPFDEIRLKYPRTAEYLLRNRHVLESREKNKMRGPKWYGYVYLKNLARQAEPKICIPRLVDRLYATIDMTGSSYLDNVDVCGIDTNQDHAHLDRRYILGLLCCSLLRWYFPFVSAPFRGGWLSANRQFISQLPIRVPDLRDTREQARHDKMVSLVQRMLDLHKRLQAAKTDHERTALQRQIAATDDEIDHLVYELYELTDEEIALVEGSGS